MFRFLTGTVVKQDKNEFGEPTRTVLGTLKRLRPVPPGYDDSNLPARETSEAHGSLFASRSETPMLAKGNRVEIVQNGKKYVWRVASDPMWTLNTVSDRYAVEIEAVI